MLTLSFHYSSAATSQFGNGNVTITLVCGVSIVSLTTCTCKTVYLCTSEITKRYGVCMATQNKPPLFDICPYLQFGHVDSCILGLSCILVHVCMCVP